MSTLKYYDSRYKNAFSANSISIEYTPAVLKEFSSGWLIEYYVYHPEKMTMRRQREKIERVRKHLDSDTATRRYA